MSNTTKAKPEVQPTNEIKTNTQAKPAGPTQQQLDKPFQQRLGAMLTAETLARSRQVLQSQEKQAQQRRDYERQKLNQNQK